MRCEITVESCCHSELFMLGSISSCLYRATLIYVAERLRERERERERELVSWCFEPSQERERERECVYKCIHMRICMCVGTCTRSLK